VRRRPYQVVLLDEIEKAHPDVFNVLLQVLDDGRLTDGQGRTVDFRNTIIIMTSNLGSEHLQLVDDAEDARDSVMASVRGHFRPEFLNRIDEIILFRKLAEEHMGAIVDIQLGYLDRLLADRRMTVEIDADARAWLAAKGYDPAYGARPLKRVIQKELQDPLARLLLEGGIKDGDTIKVSTEAGVLTVNGVAVGVKKPTLEVVN
jgi:ATP-dependent Clp protease ATP-binding subunit ClpB